MTELLVDVPVPSALAGQPPADTTLELEVNAWGPFQIYLEDAPTRPAYIGSRLRFEYDATRRRMLVRFWPVGLEPDKVYTIKPGQPALPMGNILRVPTEEHGIMTIVAVPEKNREDMAAAARLKLAGNHHSTGRQRAGLSPRPLTSRPRPRPGVRPARLASAEQEQSRRASV
jgi:hypothetical protein